MHVKIDNRIETDENDIVEHMSPSGSLFGDDFSWTIGGMTFNLWQTIALVVVVLAILVFSYMLLFTEDAEGAYPEQMFVAGAMMPPPMPRMPSARLPSARLPSARLPSARLPSARLPSPYVMPAPRKPAKKSAKKAGKKSAGKKGKGRVTIEL